MIFTLNTITDMSHHNKSTRNVPMNASHSSRETLANTAGDLLASNNPGKWIAGIAIGTIAVAGMAITAISKLDNGQ